jgi:hypothetical protein
VPPSNTAAEGWLPSGRTAPAGLCDTGGDTAGCAGSIVGGAVSSGFDEQPATKASKNNRAAKRHRTAYLSSDSNGYSSNVEHQSQILRNGSASNIAMLRTRAGTGEVSY